MDHPESMARTGRAPDALRAVTIERGAAPYAEGSCLIAFGQTRVLCTASVEEGVPSWRRGRGEGWMTAEYAMLPRATHTRTARERAQVGGRTQEIQRLIGRSLRAMLDDFRFGEFTVRVAGTWCRGQQVYDGRRIVNNPGDGRFLRPRKA